MKLRIPCMQCFQGQGHPPDELMLVEMRDDGLYSATCTAGHTTVTALQQQKFEILFDLGIMALLDGYPREGITSVAASLERFYEFYIRVICIKHGVDQDRVSTSWPLVENQSERQFGAYLFAYLLDRKTANPLSIDETKPVLPGVSKGDTRSWKRFRNAVVHKGYIPSTTEALAYGNLVYGHINDLLRELRSNDAEHLQKATFLHLSRAIAAASGSRVSTMSIPTLISLTRGGPSPGSLEEAMKELEKYRQWLHYT